MAAIVVVFDTNILLSALLSLRGAPFRCLTQAKMDRLSFLVRRPSSVVCFNAKVQEFCVLNVEF